MKNFIQSLLQIGFLCLISIPSQAATLTVNVFDDPAPQSAPNGCNSGGRCSLREAVIQANENAGPDTIILAAGTYILSIPKADPAESDTQDPKSGDLDNISTVNGVSDTNVPNGLALKGAGMNETIIQADPGLNDRLLAILHNQGAPSYEISNLTIRDGQSSASGGGLYFSTGGSFNFILKNVKFENNKAGNSGGGAHVGFGGTGRLTTENAIFHQNISESFGGGLYMSGSNTILQMTGGEVTENQGKGYGGGIYAGGGSSNPNSDFLMHTFRGVTVRGNIVSASGGDPGRAGGISCGASLGCGLLEGNLIENNQSQSDGAGVLMNSGGHSRVEKSTFRNNAILGSSGNGGGIFLSGPEGTVHGSTFSGNQAPGSGGGLYLNVGGGNGVRYSTFSGNQAKDKGGAIAFAGGHLFYSHLTMAQNSAGAGGGIANINNLNHTDGFISNTIFFQNVATSLAGTADCVGKIDNEQWNIYGDQTIFDPTHCDISTNGPDPNTDLVDPDPQIGPLADNGGPTPTHALLAGSPAIDKGICDQSGVFPNMDQRGQKAPIGANCDIGAVEAGTADVEIGMTGEPGAVTVGGTVTLTLNVKNGGPDDAFSSRVAIPLAGMTFASASSEACAVTQDTVNCILKDLAPGESGTAAFTVNAVAEGKVTHTATLVGSEIDPNTGNNSASVETTVNPASGAGGGGGCALAALSGSSFSAWGWVLAVTAPVAGAASFSLGTHRTRSPRPPRPRNPHEPRGRRFF